MEKGDRCKLSYGELQLCNIAGIFIKDNTLYKNRFSNLKNLKTDSIIIAGKTIICNLDKSRRHKVEVILKDCLEDHKLIFNSNNQVSRESFILGLNKILKDNGGSELIV